MFLKIVILYCALSVINNTKAFVRRDVSSASSNPLESLQKNLEQFKNCIDQTLSQAVGGVNEKHLQPVFTVLGDSLNRVSKAFEDLTATTKKPFQFDFK